MPFYYWFCGPIDHFIFHVSTQTNKMEKWLRVHILGLSICMLTMYVLVSTFILVWYKLEWCYVQAISTLSSCFTIQNACLLVSAIFLSFSLLHLGVICSWWNLIICSWYLSRVVILQRWSNLWKSNKSRMKTKQQQDCIHSSLYIDIPMELFNYSDFFYYNSLVLV